MRERVRRITAWCAAGASLAMLSAAAWGNVGEGDAASPRAHLETNLPGAFDDEVDSAAEMDSDEDGFRLDDAVAVTRSLAVEFDIEAPRQPSTATLVSVRP